MVTAPRPRWSAQFGTDGRMAGTVVAAEDDWARVRVKRKFASGLVQ